MGVHWTEGKSSLHIHCLEMIMGSFAVPSIAKGKTPCCILLRMDSVTAVRYINQLGGTRSHLLSNLTKDIYQFCFDREISRIPTGLLQFYGKLVLQILAGLQQLATRSKDFLRPAEPTRPLSSGSVCLTLKPSALVVLQLASRPIRYNHRRIH